MIHAEGLVKIYKSNELEVVALQGLDLQIEDGELTAIIGNSGSGKSTLLNMLGGLDKPYLETEEREEDSHIEYAVVDKAGRLQIPAGYLDTEGFKGQGRVRVAMDDGRIVLYPPGAPEDRRSE